MGRSLSKKSSKIDYYHTWNDNHKTGVYFIRDYNTCFIQIIKYKKGEHDPVTNYEFQFDTFLPTLCGIRLNRSWGNTNDDHPIYFKTLESAKYHACKKWDLNRALYPILFNDLKNNGSMVKKLVELNLSSKFKPYAD